MLPSTLQDTTNIKPQLCSSVSVWEIKKKKSTFRESVGLPRPPNPSIYTISQSQIHQLNPMVPVQATCYLRTVRCCQLPSIKAVGDFSRLDPPQILLLSLGFCGPKTLQSHTEKGNEAKGQKESSRRWPASPGCLISDFSVTPQDGLLNFRF